MEEKVESQVGRRLFAMMVDLLLMSIISFFLFGLVVHPIVSNIQSYNQVITIYKDDNQKYNDIQDEYGIFYYDENNTRIENKSVSEEIKNCFLNDERIIELSDRIIDEQHQILKYIVLEATLTIFVSSFIVFYIVPLLLRKGRTLGKYILKLYVINYKFEYVKWYALLLRQFLYIIINVILGIFTLGIMPLVSLLICILSKKNQTLYDLAAKTYVIDGKIPLEVNIKYLKKIKDNI